MFRILTRKIAPEIAKAVTKNAMKFGADFVQGAAENELKDVLKLPNAQTGKPNLGGAMASILREQYKNGGSKSKAVMDTAMKSSPAVIESTPQINAASLHAYRAKAASVNYAPTYTSVGTQAFISTHGKETKS
ncbi:hypothetical protein [Actimicrobium antarcticum]|uniref:Uncharacterized protein n=1 Tax=Actimicrobium antarcticum TaxID=1051899 RepID=A0ABP7TPS9_9BURK